MATTPQGDDSDVRRTVMEALTRSVARQRLAGVAPTAGSKRPRRLAATYTPLTAPSPMKVSRMAKR